MCVSERRVPRELCVAPRAGLEPPRRTPTTRQSAARGNLGDLCPRDLLWRTGVVILFLSLASRRRCSYRKSKRKLLKIPRSSPFCPKYSESRVQRARGNLCPRQSRVFRALTFPPARPRGGERRPHMCNRAHALSESRQRTGQRVQPASCASSPSWSSCASS